MNLKDQRVQKRMKNEFLATQNIDAIDCNCGEKDMSCEEMCKDITRGEHLQLTEVIACETATLC